MEDVGNVDAFVAKLQKENEYPPTYYQNRLDEDSDDLDGLEENYAKGTLQEMNRVKALWDRYCAYIGRDPRDLMENVSLSVLQNFFTWRLNLKTGMDGRQLPGTKKSSSLDTYWKQFQQAYTREMRRSVDGKIRRGMRKVLHRLAESHELSHEPRDKTPMYVEDLKMVLRTNLRTAKKRYYHGRIRMEIQFFLQLAGFTANRPQAALELKYKHINVCLLRDPEGGPHRILLEFTFAFTKRHLGVKDVNTFPIPEIVYDPSLIFSPHVMLLGFIFADQAFAAPSLTTPERLSKLQIRPGRNQLWLPFKAEMAEVPVLRAATRSLHGWKVAPREALTAAVVRKSMKVIGEITGFWQITRPYSLRYAAGKAFNDNGNVSEALQNLMMQHADARTFVKHYLPRRVTADTAAIVRGLAPQESTMRAACTMSRWIDPNRPSALTLEQSQSVNDHPSVRRLLEARHMLKKRVQGSVSKHVNYQQLNRMIISQKERLRAALLRQVKATYEMDEPVRDIEQQLSGVETLAEDEITSGELDEVLPQQRRLIECLILAPPGATLEQELQRRDNAINAVTAYCHIEEGDMYGGRKRRGGRPRAELPRERTAPSPSGELLREATLSVYIGHNKSARPRRCFVCLGNDSAPLADRTYEFRSPGDVSKHFKRMHLKRLKDDETSECKLCNLKMVHKMHLRNHALSIHGIVS